MAIRLLHRSGWALLALAALFVVPTFAQTPAPQPPTVRRRPPREFALHALEPDFWKLIAKDAKLETVATGFGFLEGPVWDRAGFAYVSDESTNEILRIEADGSRKQILALGDPDGNTYDRAQHLIDCASVLRAIILVNPDDTYKTLAERYNGQRFNSPNDVVLGPDGALYFTDPTLDLPKGQQQEIPFQGVYRLDSSGKVSLLTRELDQPNGLAFSPRGDRLYVDDSKQKNIRVYPFSKHGLGAGRIFGSEDVPGERGVPDGIRVDRAGNLYITGPSGIWVWDPTGRHLGTIVVPRQPANLAWGGPNYDTLYITAGDSFYKLHTLARGFVPYARSRRRFRQ
jgi:gluconolactonase